MLEHIDALIGFVGVLLLASLLVTILTQLVLTVLNLRGRNLLWGLTRLLVVLEPDLEDEAKKVVRKILHHPLISRYRRRLPAVIRMEEFSLILVRLAESSDLEEFSPKTREALKRLVKVDPELLLKQLGKLSGELEEKAHRQYRNLQQEIFQHLKQARLKLQELEAWFDNMTDRMSERFGFHSRLVTVAGALVVTLVFQLDSVSLFQQIYSNPQLKAKLVANAEFVMQESQQVLGFRTAHDLALDSLRVLLPEIPDPGRSFPSRISAERWLTGHLPASYRPDSVLTLYRQIQRDIAARQIDTLVKQLENLQDQLAGLNLQFFGAAYSWRIREWSFAKIVGMLVTLGLLSLGAPFWYNVLKNLLGLRSRLMRREEEERQVRRQMKRIPG